MAAKNPFNRQYRLVRSGIRAGLREIGGKLKKTAMDGIKNPPKTGNIYIRFGKRHQASAPGEYPANMTGRLRRGITATIENTTTMKFGADAPYAVYLQQTNHPDKQSSWKKIAPRPFLTKAHRAVEPEFETMMETNMARNLNK